VATSIAAPAGHLLGDNGFMSAVVWSETSPDFGRSTPNAPSNRLPQPAKEGRLFPGRRVALLPPDCPDGRSQIADVKFQIADFKFQIAVPQPRDCSRPPNADDE
jgi:hypothetical protein